MLPRSKAFAIDGEGKRWRHIRGFAVLQSFTTSAFEMKLIAIEAVVSSIDCYCFRHAQMHSTTTGRDTEIEKAVVTFERSRKAAEVRRFVGRFFCFYLF